MKKIDTTITGWKFPKKCTQSRLYTIWNSIKQRCYTKSCTSYKRYGARGISMCDEWKNNYMEFYNWAIQNGYSDNLTIDRIDTNGNYEPSNCRWATYKEQANNTRKIKRYTFNGETHTPREWEEIVGIRWQTIRYRIKILGWSVEKALTTETQKRTKL